MCTQCGFELEFDGDQSHKSASRRRYLQPQTWAEMEVMDTSVHWGTIMLDGGGIMYMEYQQVRVSSVPRSN